jgi:nicotinamidase-related amidase
MPDALIVIDMQCGSFIDAPPKHDAVGLVSRLNGLAAAVRRSGGSVIYIQHDGPPGDPHHPSQPGWHLLEELDVQPADTIVRKTACDAFVATPLESLLPTAASTG